MILIWTTLAIIGKTGMVILEVQGQFNLNFLMHAFLYLKFLV
jgi:hypothetical protein